MGSEDLQRISAEASGQTADARFTYEMVQKIVAAAPQPVWICNLSGQVIWKNPLADDQPKGESLGELTDLAAPDWPQQADETVRLADGGLLQCLAVTPAGPLLYVLRLPAEAETHLATSTAVMAMAHDLRAPLQALGLAAEALGHGRAPQGPEAEVAALAEIALEHLQMLLRSARPQVQGKRPEAFDLLRMVRRLVQLLRPICAQHGHMLKSDIPAGTLWLEGEPQHLQVALQNLILNAARFNHQGPIWLRLAHARQGANVAVSIALEDHGPGLSAAARAVLQAAVRHEPGVPLTSAPSQDGYGLGLGLIGQAMHRLQGQITVHDRPEGGTRFDMALCLPSCAAPVAQASGLPHLTDLSGKHLWVVEDNPLALTILIRGLRETGAQISGAASGAEALALLETGELPAPDLILLDFQLPDMSGFDLALALRAALDPVPVMIGLSADDTAAARDRAQAAGIAKVLTKPVRPSELRQILAEIFASATPLRADRLKQKVPPIMINHAMVQELKEDMGQAATLAFMRQALAEAGEVIAAAKAGEASQPLRQKIHSAIGSSGLTGLSGVDQLLRNLQNAVKAEADIAPIIADSGQVLDQTAAEIAALARS